MGGHRIITTRPLSRGLCEAIEGDPRTRRLGIEVSLFRDVDFAAESFFENFGARDLFLLRSLGPTSYKSDPETITANFMAAELWNLAQGLEAAFPREQFVNPPAATLLACSKPIQLRKAAEVGLNVPETIVTASTRRARDFIEAAAARSRRCIIKPIDTTVAQNPEDPADTLLLFTKEIRANELDEAYDGTFGAPVIIQTMVEKQHELRAVVFAGQAIAIRIDSQRHPDARHDWRWRQADRTILSYTDKLDEITPSLQAYLDSVGLDSGVFDIAVDRSGTPVFLECNPGGQWGGMDAALGGRIASAYSDFLLERVCALDGGIAASDGLWAEDVGGDVEEISIRLFTLPGCEPCEIVKAALDHEIFRDVGSVSVQTMSLEEMRAFRRNHGKLNFPVVKLSRAGQEAKFRIGAESMEVETERQNIRAWVDNITVKGPFMLPVQRQPSASMR